MWRRKIAALFAAAALGGAALGPGAQAAGAAGGEAELVHMDPQRMYFAAPDGADDPSNRFSVILATRSESEVPAEDVVAVHDASSLEGEVTLHDLHSDCTAEGLVVTCEMGDFYQRTDRRPFRIRSVAGAPAGEAGAIATKVTSSNAGGISHTTRVFLGKPELRERDHQPYTIPAAGSPELPSITPGFGNVGQVAAPEGVLLWVSVLESGSTLSGTRYSNCLYHPEGGSAWCEFPDPLKPGTAFETNAPFQAVTDDCCWVEGHYSYHIVPVGNPGELTDMAQYVRGDGPVLGLEPIEAGTLPEFGGHLPFRSAGVPEADYAVEGLTIRGQVGELVRMDPPDVQNLGPDTEAPWIDGTELELPEGVVLEVPHMDQEQNPCGYDEDREVVVCGDGHLAYLQVRIVERVAEPQGTVKIPMPEGVTDPDLSNNSAPITVEYTNGGTPGDAGSGGANDSGTGDSSGATAGSSSGPGDSSAGSGNGQGAPGGSMARTGASGVTLLLGVAAVALVIGATLVAMRVRRARSTAAGRI